MKFFSGFSLKEEEELFRDLFIGDKFSVAGFSYGAIKAFEYTLKSNKRVDNLILISPAFFQTKDKKFKKLQLIYYKKDKIAYTENFLKNCSLPSDFNLSPYVTQPQENDLEELLNYVWEKEKVETILSRGTKITVHTGFEDTIVSSEEIGNFFKDFATVYRYKKKGHILK